MYNGRALEILSRSGIDCADLRRWSVCIFGELHLQQIHYGDKLKELKALHAVEMNHQFTRGYGVAIAQLGGNLFDEPTLASELIKNINFKLVDFEEAGCDEYDLVVIRKLFGEEC